MWIVLHLCTGFQLLHLFFQYPAEIVRFPAGYVSSPKGCQLQVSCPKIFTRFGEKKSGCEISHFNLNLHITLGCFKNKHIVPPPFSHHLFIFWGVLIGKTRSGLESAHPMAAPTPDVQWEMTRSKFSRPIRSNSLEKSSFFHPRHSQPMWRCRCVGTHVFGF